jgi:hypothetical protein
MCVHLYLDLIEVLALQGGQIPLRRPWVRGWRPRSGQSLWDRCSRHLMMVVGKKGGMTASSCRAS